MIRKKSLQRSFIAKRTDFLSQSTYSQHQRKASQRALGKRRNRSNAIGIAMLWSMSTRVACHAMHAASLISCEYNAGDMVHGQVMRRLAGGTFGSATY